MTAVGSACSRLTTSWRGRGHLPRSEPRSGPDGDDVDRLDLLAPQRRHRRRLRALCVVAGLLLELRTPRLRGAVYLVNRNGGTVHGQAAFTSCTDIGEPVDLALLLVGAAALPDALRDLAAAGIRSAVILAAGMSEIGEAGHAVQAADHRAGSGARGHLHRPELPGLHQPARQGAGLVRPDGRPEAWRHGRGVAEWRHRPHDLGLRRGAEHRRQPRGVDRQRGDARHHRRRT